MPTYSTEQLHALKTSELVASPEFLWNEIETVPEIHSREHSWRRGSHGAKRAPVMPKAAIPFSQRALFHDGSETKEAVEETGEADDDEYAARFLLKSKKSSAPKKSQEVDADGAQVVNLSYAAALAATMKMTDKPQEEQAVDDGDGWVSVAQKPRRNRNKGSFSKWKST